MGGRDRLRFVAAGIAGLVAGLYLLIGLDVITVVQGQPEAGAAPVLIAGVLFAALAVLLLATASRPVLIAGAVLQVVVLVMYLVASSDRIPAFEAWGVTVKALQVGLLAIFVAMLLRQRRSLRSHSSSSSVKRRLSRNSSTCSSPAAMRKLRPPGSFRTKNSNTAVSFMPLSR